MEIVLDEAFEIKVGDLVERIIKTSGSNKMLSREIIIVDEETKREELLGPLHYEYPRVWRRAGEDYILVWKKEDE